MDEQQRREVAERVIEARKARGWSQRRLAQEAGVSENTVLSIEGGNRQTQGAKLRAVLDALNMAQPPESIITLDGIPEDVRIFLTVAAKRLTLLDESSRARVLADIYPRLLAVD